MDKKQHSEEGQPGESGNYWINGREVSVEVWNAYQGKFAGMSWDEAQDAWWAEQQQQFGGTN